MNLSNIAVTGGCLCKNTRYRAIGKAHSPCVCHCRTCQQAAGADSVSWASFQTNDFRYELGRPQEYASSKGVTRTFCRDCGTTLTYQTKAEEIDVSLATLDDPEQIQPTDEIWLSHKLSWNPASESLTRHLESK